MKCAPPFFLFHFRERGKKTKENAKKTKIENLHGQEKKRREKIGVGAHLGKIFKKYQFLQILV